MTKYGWRVVLFSGAGWFFDGYVINVWPLAIPFVMTDLQLTVENIGTITTIYVTAYMLGTLLGGTFADYLGRRSVLSFSVLFYMFVDALTAVAQGFWSLSFFRVLTGTGTGMELPVGSTFITEAVDNKWRARLISVMNAGYPIGYVLAIAGVCHDWRGLGLAWGVCRLNRPRHRGLHRQAEGIRVAALSGGLGASQARRSASRPRRQHNRLPQALCRTPCRPSFTGLATPSRSGPSIHYPALPGKGPNIPTSVELTWLATYQVWAIVMTYLGSWLSDRWGRRPFAMLFAFLTMIFVWAVTLVPDGVPLYLAGALLFGFNNATWCISFAHSTELFPTHIRGSGIGRRWPVAGSCRSWRRCSSALSRHAMGSPSPSSSARSLAARRSLAISCPRDERYRA